jgi:hypothetical protein
MGRPSKYPEDFRLEAVALALSSDESWASVARRLLFHRTGGGGMETIAQAYPATLEVDRAEQIANWRPLVQWLLAIPHFLILYGLQLVARADAVIR